MNRRTFLKSVSAFTVLAGAAHSFGEELKAIMLVKPQKEGGKSVLAALWARKTTRNISSKELDE